MASPEPPPLARLGLGASGPESARAPRPDDGCSPSSLYLTAALARLPPKGVRLWTGLTRPRPFGPHGPAARGRIAVAALAGVALDPRCGRALPHRHVRDGPARGRGDAGTRPVADPRARPRGRPRQRASPCSTTSAPPGAARASCSTASGRIRASRRRSTASSWPRASSTGSARTDATRRPSTSSSGASRSRPFPR